MPTSPTLSPDELEALYQSTIRPDLTAFEKRRRKAGWSFWGRFWLSVIGVTAVLIIGETMISTGAGLGLAIVVGFAAWRWATAPLQKVTREAKAGVLATIARAIGVDYTLEGFPFPVARFTELRLVNDFDTGDFEDLFSGERSGAQVSLCDARLLSRSTDNQGRERHIVVFRGSMIRIAFPKRFLGVTVVRREAGMFNRGRETETLKRVGLGASAFEKIFEVYGSDQVEARYLVHPAFMETLIALEQRLKGDHIRCAFEGGDLLIALDGKNRFEIGGKFKTLVRPEKVKEMAADVLTVMGIVDTVLAGSPQAYPAASPQQGASA